MLTFFFLFVCVQGLSLLQKSFLRPSQPGSCAWLSPFLLCANLPDPINHVCSLTGKQISKNYFTYRSVQILKIMFWRFLFSRIWSSSQDHAVLVLLLNLVGFFISTWPMVRWKCFVPQLYQFRRGISGGPALKYFYMIHRGGRHTCVLGCVCLCVFVWKCIIKVLHITKHKQNRDDVTCHIKVQTKIDVHIDEKQAVKWPVTEYNTNK